MTKIIVVLTVFSVMATVAMIQISAENSKYLILWSYLLVSLVSFVMYAFDKSASRSGRWRVPENSLHTLTLFGGWPGAMLGQGILRHKTVKQPFRFIFWLTVAINCAATFWFLFPELVNRFI